MESPVPPFLESITRDRAAVLAQAWRDCEGIPPKTGLMRIAHQTSLDFRIVRYWFYCRSNYEGITRAYDALGPRKKLEMPKLEEYYLFDKFTDDLDAPDTAAQTPQALGSSHYASPTSNQQNQPTLAQAESSSSASTQGRARRASTTTPKKQPKPATTTKKKLQRPPTEKPNENGKRRQDPAGEEREVKAASKARTKRTKTSAASAAPPPTETPSEVDPAVSTAETAVTTAPALTPSDHLSQDTTTQTGSIISMTTAVSSDMDSTPQLSATATQEAIMPTHSPSAGAADVNMEDLTTAVECDPPSVATPSTQSSVGSGIRRPKMIMSAVIIPPYRGSSSGSSSPTSSRRHITTLRLPAAAMQSSTLNGTSSASALEAETVDPLTSASTPKQRFKLIRNRMEPRKQSRCSGTNKESITPSTNNAGADLAIDQEVVLQLEKPTATDASLLGTRVNDKIAPSKRRALSTMATSDSEQSTLTANIQLENRSKSVPLSASRDGEPKSQITPEPEDLNEQALHDSDQDDEVMLESRSHLPAADIPPVPIDKDTGGLNSRDRMAKEAEDKEMMTADDQEEGHLGTARSVSLSNSKADSYQQPKTLTVRKTRDGGDVVQREKQGERFLGQQRTARLSRSRSRGPSTAPSRSRVSAPDDGILIETAQISTAQYGLAVDATDDEVNESTTTSSGQQDRGTSAQLLWDQPWTKQYASIRPMKRRSTMMESDAVPSSSKSSHITPITSSSNSASSTMAPDERMASEKKIISMDQTPPTPKSTEDADHQARSIHYKESEECKNDSWQLVNEEDIQAALAPTFSNGRLHVTTQPPDEMDDGGSSYSPNVTYDCLSPTDPYHSDDSWTKGLDIENNVSTSPVVHGHHRNIILATDDRDIPDRSRKGDHRSGYSSRPLHSRDHGDHSRERGHRRRSNRSSDRTRGRSRDKSKDHSSRLQHSRDRSKGRSGGHPSSANRSRDRSTERIGSHSSRTHHSNDRSRGRAGSHSNKPYYAHDRSRDRSGGYSNRPHHSNDRSRDRSRDRSNKTRRSRARSRDHSEDRSRGYSSRSHHYDEAGAKLPERYY